jgi:hypothetical protein
LEDFEVKDNLAFNLAFSSEFLQLFSMVLRMPCIFVPLGISDVRRQKEGTRSG